MTGEYPYREPHPPGGTDSGEDEELKVKKPDARTVKELADLNSMKFGRLKG